MTTNTWWLRRSLVTVAALGLFAAGCGSSVDPFSGAGGAGGGDGGGDAGSGGAGNGRPSASSSSSSGAGGDDGCKPGGSRDCGNPLWAKRFGDASGQMGRTVAIDAAGNVVMTGWFEGTADFGGGTLSSAGGNDIFVAKFDAAGNHLWSKRFGDGGEQFASSVAIDAAGNVVLTGEFTGSLDFGGGALFGNDPNVATFIAKLDPSGNHVWSKRYGGLEAHGVGVATDAAGDVVVAGYYRGEIDFGGGILTQAGGAEGGHDVFVAKLGPLGGHLWSKTFGDAGEQFAGGLALDPGGNVLVTGDFANTIDFGGGQLASADGISSDIYVVKFDPSGNHLWSRRYGDAGSQIPTGIATDFASGVVLTGYFENTVDFGGGQLASAGGDDAFVAKLDAAGSHVWSKRFGDAGQQFGDGIATDASGDVVVTGDFVGTADFGGGALISAGSSDIFVAKFDVSGNHVWSQRFGDAADQVPDGLAIDTAGNAVVTGVFAGAVQFGSATVSSAGGRDIFLTKLSP